MIDRLIEQQRQEEIAARQRELERKRQQQKSIEQKNLKQIKIYRGSEKGI